MLFAIFFIFCQSHFEYSSDTVVFEDALYAVESAKKAQCTVIGVYDEYSFLMLKYSRPFPWFSYMLIPLQVHMRSMLQLLLLIDYMGKMNAEMLQEGAKIEVR